MRWQNPRLVIRGQAWGGDDREYHFGQSLPRNRSLAGEHLLPARHLWKPTALRIFGRSEAYAVSRYDSIHFSPDYWTWSRLPGSPPEGGAHAAYMRQHGTGLHIYEMDGFYAGFSTISRGIRKDSNSSAVSQGDDASGELSYFSVTNCDTALHVDDAKGFRIVGQHLAGIRIWHLGQRPYSLQDAHDSHRGRKTFDLDQKWSRRAGQLHHDR